MTCLMTPDPMITGMLNWISPSTMRALGWSLVHFLWQGTAIAAITAGAMALCRRSALRYALGVSGLVLMFLAPLVTFSVYLQGHSGAADSTISSPLTAAAWMPSRERSAASNSISASEMPMPVVPTPVAFLWLIEAWLAGVTFFSLRSAGGFLLLERKRRRQSTIVSPRLLEICYRLQDQMGLNRAIQYCECAWLQAPAVIGWFRPIVFLPATALTGLSEEQLQAVIAHELAHIYRFDAFVNVFQVFLETVLFYHPAVWWLNKRIRAEREHSCDDIAVDLCGNAVEYARALTLMEEWRSAPVLAMAANGSPLKERVLRVLGLRTLGVGMRGIGVTGSILCCTAALAAGNALIGMAQPRPVQAALAAQFVPHALVTRAASPQAPHSTTSNTKPSAAQAQSSETNQASSSYIDRMKAAGVTDITVDTLISLKIQDVTPEYVRGLQEQGLHPDTQALIAMREQGITPDYVQEFRAAGLNPGQDQLIALKIQGADANYYRAMKQAGLDPDVDKLIAMKIQDVTPQEVSGLRAAGLSVTAEKAIALKIQGVSPEYLKQMHDLGIRPQTDEAIGMRVQGVTPEYVRAIQSLGLKPTTQELIAMRVQDVTPDYIKALQTGGFKLSINDIIGAKVQDITPEFIEEAQKHGFKDLTLQKLIQLRQLGILDSKADL